MSNAQVELIQGFKDLGLSLDSLEDRETLRRIIQAASLETDREKLAFVRQLSDLAIRDGVAARYPRQLVPYVPKALEEPQSSSQPFYGDEHWKAHVKRCQEDEGDAVVRFESFEAYACRSRDERILRLCGKIRHHIEEGMPIRLLFSQLAHRCARRVQP